MTAFVGAARLDLATPAYGYYLGGGVELKELWPSWSLAVDVRFGDKLARDNVLPTRSARRDRPDNFYDLRGVSRLLEPPILSGDQPPRSFAYERSSNATTVAAAAAASRARVLRVREQRQGPLRQLRGLGAIEQPAAHTRPASTRSHRRAATSARARPWPAPRRAPCRTPRNARRRETDRVPRTSARGAGSSADTARRRSRTSACVRACSGSSFEPTTRNRASGRALAMRAAQSRKRSRPRLAKSPEVTNPTSGARGSTPSALRAPPRNSAARCERVAPRRSSPDKERPARSRAMPKCTCSASATSFELATTVAVGFSAAKNSRSRCAQPRRRRAASAARPRSRDCARRRARHSAMHKP